MAKSGKLSTLETVGGVEYVFDAEGFRRLYDGMEGRLRPRGEKGRIVCDLAGMTGFAESTVRTWIRGDNGPSEIGAVHEIEDFFGVPRGRLLTPRMKDDDEGEGCEMREIPDYERDAARKVYRELCVLTDGLYYCDPELSMKAGWSTTMMGFKYLGETTYPFEYRQHLQLMIRQEGFDLPKALCNALSSLVDEAFGDDCGEEGLLYLSSENYAAWLEANGLVNGEDAREKYSIVYTRQLEERIDGLFADYMRN